MKKLLSLLFALSLLAFSVNMFTSCSSGDDGTSGGSTQNPDPKPSDDDDTSGKLAVTPNLDAIFITTTNPKDPANPLAFVTEPISDTVKLHSHTWGDSSKDNIPAPWYEECTVTVVDSGKTEVLTDVKANVKARGNWTTSYDKKGLRIKFDKKQSMLGLHKGKEYKNWVLLAEWKDFSMLRDYSAYYLAHLLSNKYYASDCKLVEVYINNNYWGVYLLAEQQEAKRVGITEAKENDGVTETGYLLEYDYYAELVATETLNGEKLEQDFVKIEGYGSYTDINGKTGPAGQNYYTIKSKYDDAKKAFIKTKLQTIWDTCRDAIETHESETTVPAEIEAVVDIDSLVDTFILCELACDLDLNWSSFYMDIDYGSGGSGKLTFEAPWDFDSCFGNHVNHQNKQISGLVSLAFDEANYCNGNPWTILFGKTAWFQEKVRTKWASFTAAGAKNKVISEINRISSDTSYKNAFANNYNKWKNIGNNIGDELAPESALCTTEKQAADLLVKWFTDRFAELDDAFDNTKNPTFVANKYVLPSEDSITQKVFTEYDNNGNKLGTFDDDVKLTVKAQTDGLHITKQHNSQFKRISVEVTDVTNATNKIILASVSDIDKYNANSDTVTPKNEFVYPYVEANHDYTVKLVMMTGDYKKWHSVEVTVKAVGGSGNFNFTFDRYLFNPTDLTITFTNLTWGSGFEIITDSTYYHYAYLYSDKVWGTTVEPGYSGRWEVISGEAEPMKIQIGTYEYPTFTPSTINSLPSKLFIVLKYDFTNSEGLNFIHDIIQGQIYSAQ